ncbi:hypothetical protein [Micromonospora sp. WMMD1155]|nr:hypothetical protein [Micromonospora sp. WMMD1155]WFE53633.1 hypothetical protein O7617_26360 [Micromonospora sp. WMMD1155]
MVDQDSTQAVTMHHLDGEHYIARATTPLAWLLNAGLYEHDLG